jgi:hypothetical protein
LFIASQSGVYFKNTGPRSGQNHRFTALAGGFNLGTQIQITLVI